MDELRDTRDVLHIGLSVVAQFAFLQLRSSETVARQRADIVMGFFYLFKC